MGILRWFLKSKVGRVVGFAILLVVAAAVGQFVLVELPKQQKASERKSDFDALERAADALEDMKSPPKSTAWFPANYACGRTVTLANVSEPWKTFGFSDGDKTSMEYRLDTSDDGYTLFARIDSDCDGVYTTHRIEGTSDWTQPFSRKKEIKNLRD